MGHTNAHITLHQIVTSWRGNKGYPIHYYVPALLLAAEAIQELALTSMPMLQHVLLTRQAGQTWFDLPDDYTDYVRVGVRHGETWHPLTISERLMPYTNSDRTGDMDSDEFGADLNTGGGNSSWYAGAVTQPSFSPASFSAASFQTAATTAAVTPVAPDSWGFDRWSREHWRQGVVVNSERGQIVVPELFGHDEIYLVYTGIGRFDNATGIPVLAQAAIEAYIDYKYAANKRDVSRGEASDWERKFDNQHRLLRARMQKWSIEDVARAFDRYEEQFSPIAANGAVAYQPNTHTITGFPYTLSFVLS